MLMMKKLYRTRSWGVAKTGHWSVETEPRPRHGKPRLETSRDKRRVSRLRQWMTITHWKFCRLKKRRSWTQDICIAPFRNIGSHSFTFHAHARLSTNGMSHTAFTLSRSASSHFDRYSFPVPRRMGGWVGLDGWLHTEMVCTPKDGRHSSTIRPIARRPGIELTAVESQVRRPNH